MRRDGRLGVGIIGAGRVGPVIGAALGGAGHAIVGITQRIGRRARRGDPARACPCSTPSRWCGAASSSSSPCRTTSSPASSAGLAELGAWQPGQLVLHTDPAFGTDVLAPAAGQGRDPARRASRRSRSPAPRSTCRQLAHAYAAVTAPGPVLPIAQALAVELGCEPVVVAEEDRRRVRRGARDRDRVLPLDRAAVHRPARAGRRAEPRRVPLGARHSTVDHALTDAGSGYGDGATATING